MAKYEWTIGEAIGYAWATVETYCNLYHKPKCHKCEDVITVLRKHVENGK